MRDPAFAALEPGKRYRFAFLSVDAVGHTRLAREYKTEDFEVFLESFYNFITAIMNRHRGCEWHWAGDGGIWVFWGADHALRAILAGIQLVHDISIFRHDGLRNPMAVPIEIRVAASEGPVKYRESIYKVHADCLNRVVHLQEGGTEADELTITRGLFDLQPEHQKYRFRFKQVFDGERTYRYVPPFRGRRPEDVEVDHLLGRLSSCVDQLLKNHIPNDRIAVEGDTISEIVYKTKAIYADVRHFCSWYQDIDEKWSALYFYQIASTAKRFLDVEKSMWTAIQDWLSTLPPDVVRSSGLEALRKSLAFDHGEAQSDLESLKRSLEYYARKAEHPTAGTVPAPVENREPSKDFLGVVESFAHQKEENLLARFVRVAKFDRGDLVETVASGRVFHERQPFLEKLWLLSDLVLTEDLSSGASPNDSDSFFATMSGTMEVGPKFSLLGRLLKTKDVQPYGELIEKTFQRKGYLLDEYEVQAVQRALVLGHENDSIRYLAASATPLDALWQTVAYRRTPLYPLSVISRRLVEWKEDHLKRIFFDCVFDRLHNAVKGIEDRGDLKVAGELLSSFFEHDCFAETRFFESLARMVDRIKSQASQLGEPSDLLAGWKQLSKRHAAGNFDDENSIITVEQLRTLPLPVQRYLARAGQYRMTFACHPNPNVVSELMYYINEDNVRTFVQQSQINRQFFADLLKKEYLFKEPETLVTALLNPRCNPGLSRGYLKKLNSEQLNMVAFSPSANSEVKKNAVLAVFERQGAR